MPIINCQECGGKISTSAPMCPHCGIPLAVTVEMSKPVDGQTDSKQITQASAAENVNRKVALKMFGLVLILVGIGLLVYQIVTYPALQPADIVRSGGHPSVQPIMYVPSLILFVAGGALWRAGS